MTVWRRLGVIAYSALLAIAMWGTAHGSIMCGVLLGLCIGMWIRNYKRLRNPNDKG